MKRAAIHRDNLYRYCKPNFRELPRVSKLLDSTGKLDFKDSDNLRALATDLLEVDFGVKVAELGEGHLVPTVTSRLNYVLWLHELLHPHCGSGAMEQGKFSFSRNEPEVRAVDIGCGASCIYPLLGKAVLGWRFVATEVDPHSVELATKNVAVNLWQESIQVVHNTQPETIFRVLPEGHFDVAMCNPPFYGREEDANSTLEATASEVATAGGEQSFVMRMVEESKQMKERVGWFSSLVGKKASLRPIKRKLVEAKVLQVRTTEIAQGRMSRWAIAWSYTIAPEELGERRVRRRIDTTEPASVLREIASTLNSMGFEVMTEQLRVEARLYNHMEQGKSGEILLRFELGMACLVPGQYVLQSRLLEGEQDMYDSVSEILRLAQLNY